MIVSRDFYSVTVVRDSLQENSANLFYRVLDYSTFVFNTEVVEGKAR